jgi:phage-related tail protein
MEAMGMIGGVLERVTAWTKANPELTATLVKIAAVLSVVLFAAGSLMLTIAGLAGPFIAWRFAMSSLSIALTSGVGIVGRLGSAIGMIGRVIAFVGRLFLPTMKLAITVIAGGAYLIWRNWDTLGEVCSAVGRDQAGLRHWLGVGEDIGSMVLQSAWQVHHAWRPTDAGAGNRHHQRPVSP